MADERNDGAVDDEGQAWHPEARLDEDGEERVNLEGPEGGASDDDDPEALEPSEFGDPEAHVRDE